jgi:hypothetical protein
MTEVGGGRGEYSTYRMLFAYYWGYKDTIRTLCTLRDPRVFLAFSGQAESLWFEGYSLPIL